MKRALTKPSLVTRHQIEDDMEHFKLIELHDNSGDCSEPDRALGSWAYVLIVVAALIVGLIWGAVAAHAGSLTEPRVDPEPLRPVCTTILGLPCHEGFRYREPGRQFETRTFTESLPQSQPEDDEPETEGVCE